MRNCFPVVFPSVFRKWRLWGGLWFHSVLPCLLLLATRIISCMVSLPILRDSMCFLSAVVLCNSMKNKPIKTQIPPHTQSNKGKLLFKSKLRKHECRVYNSNQHKPFSLPCYLLYFQSSFPQSVNWFCIESFCIVHFHDFNHYPLNECTLIKWIIYKHFHSYLHLPFLH